MNDGILITSPPGYQQARLFGLVLPVLFVIFAVAAGAQAVGGNEEDGSLELLISNPVARRRVVLERFLGVAALTLGLGVVALVANLALSPPFGLLEGVLIPGLAAATGATTLLGLLHGCVAFATGAVLGRRSVAIATATTVAVAGNLVNALAEASPSVHFLRFVSPWHWYLGRNMLSQGIAVEALLAPAALSMVLGAVAWWTFGRRDLR